MIIRDATRCYSNYVIFILQKPHRPVGKVGGAAIVRDEPNEEL